MGAIDHLLDDLAGVMAARPDRRVRAWVVRCLRDAGATKNAGEILALLTDLGATRGDLHALVQQKWAGPPGLIGDPRRLTPEQARDLVELLGALAGNARFLTTCGSPRSAYLRRQRLIDWLLSGMSSTRRPGEPAGSGGSWVLERFLGAGASGETWLTRDPTAGLPPRACKVFTPDHAGEWIKRGQPRLVAICRQLGGHPNIVEPIEAGLSGRREPCLAMEYLAGGSLQDWLVEDPDRREAAAKHEVLGDVVRAMAAAHRRGVAHGDLTPANILLTPGPGARAKIAGFGLDGLEASRSGENPVDADRAMYRPPEASRADPDPAGADVFALGVIWYQLLVERLERPPYDFAEVLRDAGHDSHTIGLIARCLAGPGRRFASAGELELELAGEAPPQWPPVPRGCIDVSQIVREHLAAVQASIATAGDPEGSPAVSCGR